MKYFKTWVYEKGTFNNVDLYFALEDTSEANIRALYKTFNWHFVGMPRRISKSEYACAILLYPVTNHVDCFKFRRAVVIE